MNEVVAGVRLPPPEPSKISLLREGFANTDHFYPHVAKHESVRLRVTGHGVDEYREFMHITPRNYGEPCLVDVKTGTAYSPLTGACMSSVRLRVWVPDGAIA